MPLRQIRNHCILYNVTGVPHTGGRRTKEFDRLGVALREGVTDAVRDKDWLRVRDLDAVVDLEAEREREPEAVLDNDRVSDLEAVRDRDKDMEAEEVREMEREADKDRDPVTDAVKDLVRVRLGDQERLAVKDLEPLMELVADRVRLRDVVSDRLGVRDRVWALRVRDGVFECVGVGEWVADWEGGAPGSAGGGHAIHDGWFRLFTSRPRPWPRYPNGVRASRSPSKSTSAKSSRK